MYPVFVLKLSSGERIIVNSAMVVGREESCNIFLDDKQVSRQHAKIWPQDNILHLIDLKSSNGTRLNGKIVDFEALVYPGDEIQIGDTVMRVEQVTAETTLTKLRPGLMPRRKIKINPTIIRTRPPFRYRQVIYTFAGILLFLLLFYAVIYYGFF